MKRHAPATARNREPIREVLARELPERGLVLEIASGSGEHGAFMASQFPDLEWQPTDADDDAIASIEEWRHSDGSPNLRPPLRLDARESRWPIAHADAIVCINMVHISPWEAALGLFAGAALTLASGALLYLYGPYRFDGQFTAESNAAFDHSLRTRDPRWGVRDIRDLEAAATDFALRGVVAMPANNHSLLFRRL